MDILFHLLNIFFPINKKKKRAGKEKCLRLTLSRSDCSTDGTSGKTSYNDDT